MLRDVASARSLGQRASRRDPQDGREGGSASHEASRLGHRHPSLPHRPARSATSSRRGFDRPARVSSSRTAAMAARAFGRSSSFPRSRQASDRSRAASARGSVPEEMPLGDFMTRCEAYFTADGCIVDQPFQPRLPDGMIRCYMGADKVVGFGHQFIKALIPPPPEGPDSEAGAAGPAHHARPHRRAPFQALRTKMEAEWTPQMMQVLGIDAAVAADHLGRRFPLWAAHRIRRRHLRAVRDQCQFGVCDSRPGACGDRATRLGSSSGEPAIPLAPARNPGSCAQNSDAAPPAIVLSNPFCIRASLPSLPSGHDGGRNTQIAAGSLAVARTPR